MKWKGEGAVFVAIPYREWTPRSTILAIALGIVTTIASVYSGLKIANVFGAGAIAVILFQVLKGLPGSMRGTMLEVNAGQIMASTVNVVAAGAIFTIPALYIMYTPEQLATNPDFSLVTIACAAIAGALIGVVTIVPLRRRWIHIERLPFPAGRAMAPVVRALGIPKESIAALLITAMIAVWVEMLKQNAVISSELPLGEWLVIPAYTSTAFELSLMLIAAGLLSGKGGLPFMIGGVVAYWVFAPIIANYILTPETLSAFNPKFEFDPVLGHFDSSYADGLAAIMRKKIMLPVGIGTFIGAAAVGTLVALPTLRAILRTMRGGVQVTQSELSLKTIGLVFLAGSVVILALASSMLVWWRAVLVVGVGLIYLVIANMVVTECESRSAQAPVSGLSFVGAILAFLLSGGNVVVAVTFACMICTGMCTGSDNMGDMCTTDLVGGRPRMAQMSQLVTSWIGPALAVYMVYLLARSVGFGDESAACVNKLPTCLPAPQAGAFAGLLTGLSKGGVPWDLYGTGALLGGLLTLLPVGGAGVLFGIAFYLPFSMTIPYGVGCFARMGLNRVVDETWVNRYLVPAAAGLFVGESLVGAGYAIAAARTIIQ